jgi:uncharacterized protein YbbK (DUF523 family)
VTRAEQAQPLGYVPRCPSCGCLASYVDDLRSERDALRGVIAAAYVDLLAGRVDEALAALRAAGEQP